eukprot:TRINITY_DN369_c0_g1_i1.p3 TRINITY_DN369_c0_g1~~TRINITY_DN369_c0_g1_i1.p3  ORF type:complete len:104 (-),score=8.68 TRINITY_DN369_c0_g1_i1:205-516(-)
MVAGLFPSARSRLPSATNFSPASHISKLPAASCACECGDLRVPFCRRTFVNDSLLCQRNHSQDSVTSSLSLTAVVVNVCSCVLLELRRLAVNGEKKTYLYLLC